MGTCHWQSRVLLPWGSLALVSYSLLGKLVVVKVDLWLTAKASEMRGWAGYGHVFGGSRSRVTASSSPSHISLAELSWLRLSLSQYSQ